MVCLVCTGGIGSGKTYVIRVFKALGVPTYIADIKAKELYDSDSELLKELVELLGEKILIDGRLDRRAMAGIIFSDSVLLEGVNKIVHPKVLADFKIWQESQRIKGEEIVVFESAIFFETPIFHPIADKIIVVSAPEDVRIGRIIKRDGITEREVRDRMNMQCSDIVRHQKADYIVITDGKRAVLPQIIEILNQVKGEKTDGLR